MLSLFDKRHLTPVMKKQVRDENKDEGVPCESIESGPTISSCLLCYQSKVNSFGKTSTSVSQVLQIQEVSGL